MKSKRINQGIFFPSEDSNAVLIIKAYTFFSKLLFTASAVLCLLISGAFNTAYSEEKISVVDKNGQTIFGLALKKAVDENAPLFLKVPPRHRQIAVKSLRDFSRTAFHRPSLITYENKNKNLIGLNIFIGLAKKKEQTQFKLKTLSQLDLEAIMRLIQRLITNGNTGVIDIFNTIILIMTGVNNPNSTPEVTGTGTPTVTPTPTPTTRPATGCFRDQLAKSAYIIPNNNVTYKVNGCEQVKCKDGVTIGQPGGCTKPLWNRTYGSSFECCSKQAVQVSKDYVGKGCGNCGPSTGCIGLWTCKPER